MFGNSPNKKKKNSTSLTKRLCLEWSHAWFCPPFHRHGLSTEPGDFPASKNSQRFNADQNGLCIVFKLSFYIMLPAPSKGWCLNPKGLLSGTPYHPFGTPWRVQVNLCYLHFLMFTSVLLYTLRKKTWIPFHLRTKKNPGDIFSAFFSPLKTPGFPGCATVFSRPCVKELWGKRSPQRWSLAGLPGLLAQLALHSQDGLEETLSKWWGQSSYPSYGFF